MIVVVVLAVFLLLIDILVIKAGVMMLVVKGITIVLDRAKHFIDAVDRTS